MASNRRGPRVDAVRVVDMSGSNSWAEFAGLFYATRSTFLDHERAKSELKTLMPEDAKEATGDGVGAKRASTRTISRSYVCQCTPLDLAGSPALKSA
jgi:hypothetical protein